MDKETQDAYLILRISKTWKEELLKKAKSLGMSLSKYVREQLWRIEDLSE